MNRKILSVTQDLSLKESPESSGSSGADDEYPSSDDDERDREEIMCPQEREDLASYFFDSLRDSKIIRFAKNTLFYLNIKKSDYAKYLRLLD